MTIRILSMVLISILLFTGCAGQFIIPEKPKAELPDTALSPSDIVEVPTTPEHPDMDLEGQLITLAESLEEAEQIAALYGIELLSFSDGVALFFTQEDTIEVIERGKANGWPELSENRIVYAF